MLQVTFPWFPIPLHVTSGDKSLQFWAASQASVYYKASP